MGKPSPPPPPDYTPLIQGSQQAAASDLAAANVQADVARQQLAQQNVYAGRAADVADRYAQMAQDQAAYGKQQYQDLLPYLHTYMQGQTDFQAAALENQKQQTANAALAQQQAQETYQRYMTTYAPKEDQFAQEAFDFASPARQEQAAAAARGDVATAFTATSDAAKRQLASYGVDPSQGRFGQAQAMDISRAASLAAAGTLARQQTEMQGKQLEASAIEMGQKLPAQAIAQAGLGTQQAGQGLSGAAIGGGGLAAGGNLLTAGTGAMGSPTAYAGLSNPYTQLAGTYGTQATGLYGNQIQALGGANTAFGTAGTMMSNMFSDQMANYKAQAAASPWGGIGQLAGTLGGAALGNPAIGAALVSDIRVKRDIAPYQRGLDAIEELKPVTFVYESLIEDSGRTHVGLIAQDVEPVIPEMVGEMNGIKTIDLGVVVVTLVNAVKELTDRIERLEGR